MKVYGLWRFTSSIVHLFDLPKSHRHQRCTSVVPSNTSCDWLSRWALIIPQHAIRIYQVATSGFISLTGFGVCKLLCDFPRTIIHWYSMYVKKWDLGEVPSLGGMLLGVPPASCWSKLVCAMNLYWQKFFPGFWTSELDCQPQTWRNSEGYEEHWIPSKNIQNIAESITVAPDLEHTAWSWPCTGVASEAAHMSSEGEKSTSFRFRMFQQQGPWI